MFLIPDEWKSRRQLIVETYIRTQSVPDTSELLYGKRDSSFVRSVIIQWRTIVRKNDLSSHANDEAKGEQVQSIA
jgi:hypothetical protein